MEVYEPTKCVRGSCIRCALYFSDTSGVLIRSKSRNTLTPHCFNDIMEFHAVAGSPSWPPDGVGASRVWGLERKKHKSPSGTIVIQPWLIWGGIRRLHCWKQDPDRNSDEAFVTSWATRGARHFLSYIGLAASRQPRRYNKCNRCVCKLYCARVHYHLLM